MRRFLIFAVMFLFIACGITIKAYGMGSFPDDFQLKFKLDDGTFNHEIIFNDNGQDSWREYKGLKETIKKHPEGSVWIKCTLPDKNHENPALLFLTYDQVFEVYLEGKLIYSFGDFSSLENNLSPGSSWHIIPLPYKFSGKTLYFKMKAAKKYNSGEITRLQLASRSELILRIIREDLSTLVLTILYGLIGFCALVFYIIFGRKERNNSFMYLGFSSIFMGFWLFSQTNIKQLFLDVPVFWLFSSDLSLYLLPIWFYLFLKTILEEKYSGILNAIVCALIIFLIAAFTLQSVQITSLPLIKKYFHILFVFTIIVVVLITVKSFNKNDVTKRVLATSFILLCFLGLIDIIRWYTVTSYSFKFLSQWGMLFFVLTLLITLIYQLINLQYKVKVYAEEIKLKEEILNEKKRLLQEALNYDKLKTEFFVNISHEFRTPLNIILSTLQLINLYFEKGQVVCRGFELPNHMNGIKQNCYRLLRLVNNFIDITKFDSGYMEPVYEEGDIVALVEDTTLSAVNYISSKDINLTFDTDIEEKIMCFDHDKIERIILNLLSNAVKFSEAGSSILVELHENNENIVISISDTGIGIPEEKLQSIFERFMQVDRSLTRSHEGSGIGLSLVKSLVQMHNGTISVTSECGKGSKFTVTIPANLEVTKISQNCKNRIQGNKIEKVHLEFSDL